MQSRCGVAQKRGASVESSIVPLNRRKLPTLVRLIRYIRDERCFFSFYETARQFARFPPESARADEHGRYLALVKPREVADEVTSS